MKQPGRLTVMDRAIGYFAPVWGVRRAQSRLALDTYHGTVARTGASNKGSLAEWRPRLLSRYQEENQRKTLTKRARDLHANDGNAASIVGSMALNTTGYGLHPQSLPNLDALGVDPEDDQAVEQVAKFARRAEWLFKRWSKRCDAGGRMTFGGLQYMAITRFYVDGEFFILSVRDDSAERRFSLTLQPVDPLRVRTPRGRMRDPQIRDGVILGKSSEALGYYVANRNDGRLLPAMDEKDFRIVRSRAGHRPVMIHGLLPTETDQVRGVSILAPAMETFFNLYDYLDYELLGAILAASFPVAIESQHGPGHNADDPEADPFKEVVPGRVVHLKPGQKVDTLKSNRPSDSFKPFTERLLRAAGAACGQPYERVAKDFSQTNYSSARAALLEAWKGDRLYQLWLVDSLCQPAWNMALEEFYLRGLVDTPRGMPGFYEALDAWCETDWTPPARGSIDPLKEEQAKALALKNKTTTRAKLAKEDGGDWEERARQQAREEKFYQKLELSSEVDTSVDRGGKEEED